MIQKKLILIIILFLSLVYAEGSPDEAKIFNDLHQTLRWGDSYYNKGCPLAKIEMANQLGRTKFREVNLVKSKLYGEYIRLN
jgi:hypothetical protein